LTGGEHLNIRRRGFVGALATLAALGLSGCQPRRGIVAPLPASVETSSSSDRLERRVVRVTVPAGTEIHLTLAAPIGSGTSQAGDAVTGTTTVGISVGDRVAIPAGSTVHGRVTRADPASKTVVLAFTSITTTGGASASMAGSLTTVASAQGKTAGRLGGAAGTGFAAGSRGEEVSIPSGTELAITLDGPLTIAQRP
jgi:hypothetical protein